MKTVFISHADEDAHYASQLESAMRPGGFRAWRFQRDMVGGRAWRPQLPSNIEKCEIFLLAITENSLSSETCEKEWQHATLNIKPIVTVVFERGVYPPSPLDDHQWVQFDGTAVSGAELINALQNSQPLAWKTIPSDWKKWDGKSKAELSVAKDGRREIHLPRIRSKLTDMQKQDFLSQAFAEIRSYFGQALSAFENLDPRVKTRIHDKTNMRSFNSEVHLDGKLIKRCAIWMYNPIRNEWHCLL